LFLDRKIIELNSIQDKMLSSGWGKDVIAGTVVEKIIYQSDELKIAGYLAYPSDTNRKYPCIIWCRGGFGNAGAIDEFNAKGILGQLASWGYVVFASQYRGNSKSEGEDQFGGNDLNDVLNLIPLAEELDFVDKNLWGIEGWSRGGMMAYLATTKTNLFKAAVISGGISNVDSEFVQNRFIQKLFKLTQRENPTENYDDELKSRSVICFPEKISKTTSFLILHGINDERVNVNQAIEISKKMIENKINLKLVLFDKGDHFLKNHRNEINGLRREWFGKFLK